MPGRCLTCSHPRRKEIESSILGGQSVYGIAREYKLDDSSLYRHMKKHALRDTKKAIEQRNGNAGNSLAVKVMEMYGEATEVLKAARHAQTLDAATAAIGQALRALELAGRFSGELSPQGGINITLGVRIDQAQRAVEIVQEAQNVAPRDIAVRAHRVILAWNAANPEDRDPL